MFAGNFGSPMQLLILLAIIILLFGGKRLRSLGGDLGTAIKGFKNSMAPAARDEEAINPLATPVISETIDIEKNIQQPRN